MPGQVAVVTGQYWATIQGVTVAAVTILYGELMGEFILISGRVIGYHGLGVVRVLAIEFGLDAFKVGLDGFGELKCTDIGPFELVKQWAKYASWLWVVHQGSKSSRILACMTEEWFVQLLGILVDGRVAAHEVQRVFASVAADEDATGATAYTHINIFVALS
jgi:hypothetical protein